MGYCAVADIQARFKNVTFATGTVPTLQQVTDWIAQTSAIMDGRLGLRFQVPVTGTNSLLILNNICADLVSEYVHDVLSSKGVFEPVDQTPGGKAKGTTGNKDLDDIDKILQGLILLSDAVRLSGNAGVRSHTTDVSYNRTFNFGRRDSNGSSDDGGNQW